MLNLVKEQVYLEKVEYSKVERHNKRLTEPRVRDESDKIFLDTYKKEGLKEQLRKPCHGSKGKILLTNGIGK